MGSDAIANVHLSTYANDSSEDNKNKAGTRMTQAKQNKIDVRRQPWLSQGKNKGCKVETNGGHAPPSSFEGQRTQGNAPSKTTRRDRHHHHHHILGTIDSEGTPWMSNSINKTWGRGSKDYSGSGSSSCSGSCSSSTCGEDDWEAVADALGATTINRPSPNHITKDTRPLKTVSLGVNHRYQGNSRAWSPDDVFRPRSLPTLSKLQQNPARDSGRSFSGRTTVMTWQRVVPQPPSSCPICCEDFDVTDASFHPCPCGFQLCLFCHKRILEVDSRCPGCRKQYDLAYPGKESVPFQVTRSNGRKKRF